MCFFTLYIHKWCLSSGRKNFKNFKAIIFATIFLNIKGISIIIQMMTCNTSIKMQYHLLRCIKVASSKTSTHSIIFWCILRANKKGYYACPQVCLNAVHWANSLLIYYILTNFNKENKIRQKGLQIILPSDVIIASLRLFVFISAWGDKMQQ